MKTTSPAGIAFLQSNESCVLHPYPDKGASIGWGHHLRPGDALYGPTQAVIARGLVGTALAAALAACGTWTQDEADAQFVRDIRPCEGCVNSCVNVPITQAQFDALVDFSYNEGIGALPRSTLLVELNAGNYGMAADHFLDWDKDMQGGQLVVDSDLLERRKKERTLFLSELPAEPDA